MNNARPRDVCNVLDNLPVSLRVYLQVYPYKKNKHVCVSRKYYYSYRKRRMHDVDDGCEIVQ